LSLPRNAADRDAELNWLKTLVKQLADKVNTAGDKTVLMRWPSMAFV
jgi:hypothetical protein